MSNNKEVGLIWQARTKNVKTGEESVNSCKAVDCKLLGHTLGGVGGINGSAMCYAHHGTVGWGLKAMQKALARGKDSRSRLRWISALRAQR